VSQPPKQRGRFIVLEGIDGAGKSTHIEFIAQTIRSAHGANVLITREPGGTPLAEKIRELVLHEPMDVATEVLMVAAARRDHVQRLIGPALERGDWVLCDRFIDSTRAYQGGGGGVDLGWIDAINGEVCNRLEPDRVILFDLPAHIAAARRGGRGGQEDRFEAQDVAYFERVRGVYLTRMRPGALEKTAILNAELDVSRIQKELHKIIVNI
jgi:dTMP kinase